MYIYIGLFMDVSCTQSINLYSQPYQSINQSRTGETCVVGFSDFHWRASPKRETHSCTSMMLTKPHRQNFQADRPYG